MLHIVTIVNTISVTSMPINEFVLYRYKNGYPIKQSIIVCDEKSIENVCFPADIPVYCNNNSIRKMRKIINMIIQKQDNREDSFVFHAHQDRAALIFQAASLFTKNRKSSVFTVHNTLSERRLIDKFTGSICAMLFNYIICVSDASYQKFPNYLKRLKKDRIRSIINGVDTKRIEQAIAGEVLLPRNNYRKTMVYVARMVPLKNHEFLIQLMKELPEYCLLLIGAEDEAGHIRKLAKEETVSEQIEFLGVLPRDEVYRELLRASIYVSPSLTEGLPISVLEAMQVGLVPMLSDILPHKEIARKCNDVEVIPCDVRFWKERIQACSNLSDCEFNSKIHNIIGSVSEEFSLNKMHRKYLEIYAMIGVSYAGINKNDV